MSTCRSHYKSQIFMNFLCGARHILGPPGQQLRHDGAGSEGQSMN